MIFDISSYSHDSFSLTLTNMKSWGKIFKYIYIMYIVNLKKGVSYQISCREIMQVIHEANSIG